MSNNKLREISLIIRPIWGINFLILHRLDIFTFTCIVVVLYDGPTTPTRVAFFFIASEACSELQICSLLVNVPRTKLRHCSKAVLTVPQSSRISMPSVMLGRRSVLLFTLLREKANCNSAKKLEQSQCFCLWMRCGLMVRALPSGSLAPGSGTGRVNCVFFPG